LVGTTGFNVTAVYTGGTECQGFTESLTFGATCSAASGTFVNNDGGSGMDSWTGANPTITLSRQNLTTVQANGTPSGGTFSYPTTPISGGNFATVDNPLPMSNPNTISLQGSAGNGAPTPGGFEMITAQYDVNNSTASDPFQVPTFGMSCYIIALESDYGTPPNNCTATRIYGTQSSGTVLNPGGLAGTYCASFIANLRLQGSAQLNNGQSVQYQVSTGNIVAVSTINGADGTPVVAGQTVARDRAIIPGRGVLVDVDQVGTGLLANDTGGRIRGYRLDLFNGAGRAACASFANPISVAACQPAQSACPGSALQ